jgi:hypothetical protein
MPSTPEEARIAGRTEGELHAYRNQAMMGGRKPPSMTAILSAAGVAVTLIFTLGGLLLNIGGRIEAMNGAIALLTADQARNAAAISSGRDERRAGENRQEIAIKELSNEMRGLSARQIRIEVQIDPLLRLIEPRRPQSWQEMAPPAPVQPTLHAAANE